MNEEEQKEFYKQLMERVNQLRIDILFEEPCPMYDNCEDEE